MGAHASKDTVQTQHANIDLNASSTSVESKMPEAERQSVDIVKQPAILASADMAAQPEGVVTSTDESTADSSDDQGTPPIHPVQGTKTPSDSSLGSNTTVGNGFSVEGFIAKILDSIKSSATTTPSIGIINSALAKSRSFVLKNSEVISICQHARSILLTQPTLLEVSAPIKVVGDVRGFFDACIYQ